MSLKENLERKIYAAICRHDGIKAKDIAKEVNAGKTEVNHLLYASPFMQHLCYRDRDFKWHGMIRQSFPHNGIREFCGYYSDVREFLSLSEEEWMQKLLEGCEWVGRNTNDTRGLLHSFRDSGEVIRALFSDLEGVAYEDWEIIFELRIRKSRYIRIYADVLIVTENKAFSLEFKMNDVVREEDVSQAAKYAEYLEVIFGPDYDVIPVLVLTKAEDLYTYQPLPESTAEIPVCSGDMLFNIFDEYLGFLRD